MKPIIGIVVRKDNNIFKIKSSYINAIQKCGGIPILIGGDILSYKNQVDICNGILFPGGVDVLEYDKLILNYAITLNKPVLGICMGMQLINGIEHLQPILNHHNTFHKIHIKKESILYQIIRKQEIVVNSRHYFGFKTSPYSISACAEDNIIEAIEYKNILGIEWHPEDMLYVREQKNIYQYFINICKIN